MLDTTLADFFHRHQAAVTGNGPSLPVMPPPDEWESEDVPTVFLDKEVAPEKWEPRIVLEAPARTGEFPVRFVDGAQHQRTVLWLRCPLGTPIPLVVAEVAAVTLRLHGRQFQREAYSVDRVLSFVADPFPWEEIEDFAGALLAHPQLQLRLALANRPMECHHPFDFEVMRTQAVSRARQEMSTLERIMLARNTTLPTLVDGPLHRVMGEPSADSPLVIGVVKTHAANYLHDQGWRTLLDLRPGQRTPVFCIAGKHGMQSRQGRFPIATWYLKLAGGPRLAPNWGYVRIEVPWNQFEHQFKGSFEFIGRLSRWLIDARCRAESYGRMPVSLEPIVRAEEVMKPLFSSLDALSHRLYRQAGLLRSPHP